MSGVVRVERRFASREQAEAWFDGMRRLAWPYAWCLQDPVSRQWRVTAIVERCRMAALEDDASGDATP